MKKQQKQDRIIREVIGALLGCVFGYCGTYMVYWSFGGNSPFNIPVFIIGTIVITLTVAAITYCNE